MKAAVLYFAIVFGAGFVFGIIRTLWVVPRIGTRKAELIESPLMLVVIFAGARWIVMRFGLSSIAEQIGTGVIALGLMLIAEFGFALRLRGLTIREYLATKDPVSASVYYVSLVVFAVMPAFVARR